MSRSLSVFPVLLLACCASPRFEPSALPTIAPGEPTRGTTAAAERATIFAAQEEKKGLREDRTTIKGGYYGSTEDSLDDGYILNASWTHFLNKWLAVEGEIGYLDASGNNTDAWAVPLMLNGRVNVPVWILDVYGGLGIGTFYYDLKGTGPVSGSVDGWILAGNAFVGASVSVADKIALGLEAKYYVTDDVSGSNEGLDAVAVMLTLGFAF